MNTEKIEKKLGTLYLVGTPIGNLGDITYRAVDVLMSVDIILCEDTRKAKRLLNHYQIKRKLISFHQHTTVNKLNEIISWLKEGKLIALITESGTPGISDPGGKLVGEIIKYNKRRDAIYGKIKLSPIPGPSSISAALSVSGASSKNIFFFGFLPNKKGRRKALEKIKNNWQNKITSVLFESPYRIEKISRELAEFLPEARIGLFRELTKKFEELIFLSVHELEGRLGKIIKKGEFVIIIYPKK